MLGDEMMTKTWFWSCQTEGQWKDEHKISKCNTTWERGRGSLEKGRPADLEDRGG